MSHWSSLQDNMDQCKGGNWVLHCFNRRNGKLYNFQKINAFLFAERLHWFYAINNVIFCMLKICDDISLINFDYVYESLFWLLCFPCRMWRKIIKRLRQCNCIMRKTCFLFPRQKTQWYCKNNSLYEIHMILSHSIYKNS